jgi:hypothetical protein
MGSRWRAVGGSLLLALALLGAQPTPSSGQPGPPAAGGAPLYVDTHAHLIGTRPESCDFEVAVQDALGAMDRLGIQRSLLLPPPDVRPRCDATELAAVVQRFPQRFAFLAGGGSLNPMIHEGARTSEVTDETRAAFERTAGEIVAAGAVGFGEMAALHVSLATTHPFEEAPPDHPLFLLLADLAARFDVPLDLHLDTVPEDMPFGDTQLALPLPVTGSNNPGRLAGNVAAFERLLAHNRRARIVWAHTGADATGFRTAELSRRLLEAHPNLYMQLRVLPPTPFPSTLLSPGTPPAPGRPPAAGPPRAPSIRPEWLDLIRAFPDRFVLGSDRFYRPPGAGQPFLTQLSPAQQESADRLYGVFLGQLPADLARQVGVENALRLYRLN